MSLIPKVMSTQHPDNASLAPFADSAGVLRGELVSNVVEIASRWFSSSSGDGLLGAHRQLG